MRAVAALSTEVKPESRRLNPKAPPLFGGEGRALTLGRMARQSLACFVHTPRLPD
jgi:hypothetical protein